MAVPGTPSQYFVQTANGTNYASWALTTGATSYKVQRSTDGVTYTTLATPSTPYYLDTAVTLGIQYYYQVAATNGSGDSPYTTPQFAVPTPSGEMCLGQMRLYAQQRADRVNSNFVTLPEWNVFLNQSLFELYDLLVEQYGEEYFTASAQFVTTGSNSQFYPLPDGQTTFNNAITGAAYKAPAFYKLVGVDLGLNQSAQSNNGWVTVNKFNFIDRNKYFYPNTQSTIYGVFNMSYRLFGSQIEFIPAPSGNQPIRLWYIPRMTMLLQDTDTTTSGVSGWIEYVIVKAAYYALTKEESDTTSLVMQLAALQKRIEETAANRDAGMPDTISDVNNGNWGNGWSGGRNGAIGGF